MASETSIDAPMAGKFAAYSGAVDTLLREMPTLYAAVHTDGSIESVSGWRSLEMRYAAFRDVGAAPVQVAMLFGPSGAGKSTLFRLLTGLDVPAGGEIRPMTFGCTVAAPPQLASIETLRRLFPYYNPEELHAPEQLTGSDQPADRLYFAASETSFESGTLPLVLVDVPDFTTFHVENWQKAERMLERAEIVLFVVFDEAYSDNRVLQNLALACRKASFLAYLFTKTTHSGAEKKWEHLQTVIRQSQVAARFAERRADGLTAAEFLARSPVYHSVRSEQPQLADIQPVSPRAPEFSSLLVGQDAEDNIFRGLLESTSEAVASCQEVLAHVTRVADDLKQKLARVEQDTKRAAESIAHGEFPMLRLLTIAVEEAQAIEQPWIRAVKAPVRWMMRSASSIYAAGRKVIRGFSRDRADDVSVRPLADLEREKLERQSEQLATSWRLDYPLEATADGILSATHCSRARTALLQTRVPNPGVHWESVVREAVRDWCRKHRASAIALSACGDLFAVAAGGILVLDLVHTGGLGFGTASLAAGAPAAAAAAAKFIELLNLRGVAERALMEWQEQRQRELAQHLQTHFSDVLFQPWQDRLAAIHPDKVTACRAACDTIEHLLRQSTSPSPSQVQP